MNKINILTDYLNDGWLIFPCKKDKTPYTAHGYKDSSNDIDQINAWNSTWKDANWGLDLGKADLAVIDIDVRNGGYFKEEDNSFLIGSTVSGKRYSVPKTRLVKTGGGGFHLYYQGAKTLPKLLTDGIDLKSIGGYVIIPPSIHQSGSEYTWLNDLILAPFPEEILTKEEEKPRFSLPGTITTGERNNTLFKLGCSLRSKGFEEPEIIATLESANNKCEKPLSERELSSIVSSVLKYEPSKSDTEDFQEKELSLTDLGNSERFTKLYKDKVRYSHELKTWLIWNGKYWKKDNSLEVKQLAKEVIRSIYLEASTTSDRVLQGKIASWAKSSHAEYRLDAMIELAKSDLPISPKDLDSHDFLLNLRNGVLDLITGKLLSHEPKYFFTYMIDIDYIPNRICKNWKEFLDLVIPDIEAQKFVQKSIGYSLTGSVDEQCLFFLYGKGANGKSTFIEGVNKLFGDLAQKTDAESLMGYSNGGANPYKARMRGKRFIVSSEIPDGKKWNEVLIKELTGGETLVARDIYESPYEFKPTFKIWISGNYKPKVEDDSHGFWRRMRIIPFETTIPVEKRKPMKKVLEGFDYSGILNWAIEGCRLWQNEGLQPPETVTKATEEYKGEQDILQDYLDEFCRFGDGLRISKNEFRISFLKYQKDCGYHQDVPPKKLTRLLSEKDIPVGGNGNAYYMGVSLIAEEYQEEMFLSQ